MAGGMPWFKVHAGWSSHPKVGRLCDVLGTDLADAYVGRLWDYCAERQGDGRFLNPGAVGAIERAARWSGERGALVAALVAVGLLDADGDALVVHDWADEQKAVAEKFERDRTKKGAPRGSRADSSPSPRDSLSTLNSPISTSPSSGVASASRSAELEGSARNPPPARAESARTMANDAESFAPPVASGPSLLERMCTAYAERRGGAVYPLGPTGMPRRQDAPAFAECLTLARAQVGPTGDAEAEVWRRWCIALGWQGYPACNSIRELAANWATYATPQPARPSFAGDEDKKRRAPHPGSDWSSMPVDTEPVPTVKYDGPEPF